MGAANDCRHVDILIYNCCVENAIYNVFKYGWRKNSGIEADTLIMCRRILPFRVARASDLYQLNCSPVHMKRDYFCTVFLYARQTVTIIIQCITTKVT